MRKTATKLTKVRVNDRPMFCVTWPKLGTGRNRRFFKEKPDAQTFLESKAIEQKNYGVAGTSFSERQRSEYLEASEKLKPFGKTIRDAIDFYLPHLQATNRTCNAVELTAELLDIKTADGLSERYVGDLRSRLGQFAAHFNGKAVSEITSVEIDEWLRTLSDSATGLRLAPTTRNNFRRVLIVAFNYAARARVLRQQPSNNERKSQGGEVARWYS